MAEKKAGQTQGAPAIEFFDPVAYRAAQQQEVADAIVRYLGTFQFNSPGTVKWQETCSKRGMAEKARKAKVAWWQEQHKLIFVPAEWGDAKALTVTWSGKGGRNGRIRLRSVFLHYGIEMVKDSVWQVPTTVQQVPNIGWALVVDLEEALSLVEVHKKVAAAMMAAAAGTESPGA